MKKNKWVTPSIVILVIASITSIFVLKTMNIFGDGQNVFNYWLIPLYFVIAETIYIIYVATEPKEDWDGCKMVAFLLAFVFIMISALLSAITLIILEYIVGGCAVLALLVKGNKELARTVRASK